MTYEFRINTSYLTPESYNIHNFFTVNDQDDENDDENEGDNDNNNGMTTTTK